MKAKVNGMSDLQKRIKVLEHLEKEQAAGIKESFSSILESITPSNLLKNSLKDIVASPELRTNALDTAIGIGAGFIGKKLFVGNSRNIFKKIGGTALEFLVANLVRKRIPAMREKNAETDQQ